MVILAITNSKLWLIINGYGFMLHRTQLRKFHMTSRILNKYTIFDIQRTVHRDIFL